MSDFGRSPRHRHPGDSGRRTRISARGRQPDPESMAEVGRLLGAGPHRRDHLIEHLHLIQDAFGQLASGHLVALAELTRRSLVEVYEVATFYAHFDVVEDTESAPALTIRVCDSVSCALAGGERLLETLSGRAPPGVRVVRAPCMGRCDAAPVAEVGHRHLDRAEPDAVLAAANQREIRPRLPRYQGLDEYLDAGGYDTLNVCRSGGRSVDDVITVLEHAALRGLGGAGFPTGRKWRIVRSHPGPRLLAVNADEGEPGTFKDRYYLERSPHRFLEGLLIAAWAIEAQTAYLYLRDEYPAIREILLAELAELRARDILAAVDVELRRGAGAYICGEESAMLESIEGRRGLPRHRPPYVAQTGLFGCPTLVQNVETLYWVPPLIAEGPEWFSSQGRRGAKGLRSYSVSGRVKSPGVKLAPAGISARELIDEFCDGMLEGHELKAYLPGGASGGILPASMADLPLEFGALERHGCFVGSHAVVILSQHDRIRDVALNLMRFFERESCGQCTPCRAGTQKAVALMEQPRWDSGLLTELGQTMADASICGLGQAAANPLSCALEYFAEELG